MRIGLISDTHGLLRPEALDALRGCARIVHAGDVGSAAILEALGAIAPVTAVRGNNDHGPWADALPSSVTIDCAGLLLHVLHDLAELAIEPAARGVAVVVAGHSHRPAIIERGGVLHVNPGSAGPRRFSLPITVAVLEAAGPGPRARIVELEPAPARRPR
jgi:putative phosphoesterase